MSELSHGPLEDYARQKLWQALACLIGEGDLQDRLDHAVEFLAPLSPKNFPDHLFPKYLKVDAALKTIRAERKNRQANPAAAVVSGDRERKAADDILSLFVSLKGRMTEPARRD